MKRSVTIIDENKTTSNKDVSKFIDYDDLFAYKQDIKDWVNARMTAISATLPDWTDFIRVLDDVMIDAHVSSIITTVKNKINLKEWAIFNGDEIDENATELLNKEWLHKFINYVIESLFYPYSLVFLGDMKDWNLDVKLIQREYIIPQYELIKKSLYVTNNSKASGWKYTDPKLKPYYIFLSEGETFRTVSDLGLLDKVANHALGKKHMLIYWWRFAEKFGIPFAIGKTDIRDNDRRTNMETMISQLGNSPWAVMDDEDKVDFVETKMTDAYQVFKEELNYSNNEISKCFAGAIGIFDEKSFVGSAETGLSIFEDYIQAYCVKVTNYINNELLPRLINTYKFPISSESYFKFVNKENITFEQKLETIKALLPYYDITEEEIMNKVGIEVVQKQTPSDSIMSDVNNIYSHTHSHSYLPEPKAKEKEIDFVKRAMDEMKENIPDIDKRLSACKQIYKKWQEH